MGILKSTNEELTFPKFIIYHKYVSFSCQ